MSLYIFPFTNEEKNGGDNGWDFITKHQDRLIEVHDELFSNGSDLSTFSEKYIAMFVIDGVVYEVWKRYYDMDNTRLIFSVFETTLPADIITSDEAEDAP